MAKLINTIEKIGEKWWGMMLLISIPLFVALSPVLIGGYDFTMAESQRFQQGFFFYKDAIVNNESFFWNPFLLSGFPSFVSVNGGFFNPIVYFGLHFFSVAFVYHWINFSCFVFAGLFTALFLKKLNVSFWGSFVGGMIYSFSHWPKNGDLTTNITFFLLPLSLILLLAIKRGGKLSFILNIMVGIFAIGFVWVSSFWHFLIEVLFAGAVFSLFIPVVDFYKDKSRCKESAFNLIKLHFRKYIRVPLSFLLMTVGGTVIAMVQLVPTTFFISFSGRVDQISQLVPWKDGIRPQDIIGLLLPYFHYPFSPLSIEYVDYWGIFPLLLIIIAFKFKPYNLFSSNEKKKYITFFSFLFLIGLFLSINNSPLFWLIHHLPIIDLLRGAARWMTITSFAATILTGLGLDIIVNNFEEMRKSVKVKIVSKILKWLSLFLGIVSAVAVIAIFLKDKILFLMNVYFDKFIRSDVMKLSTEFYHNYISKLFYDLVYSFNPLNPRFFIPFVFLLIGYIVIRLYISGKFYPKQFVLLVSVIVFLNFVTVYYFNDNIASRSALYKEPATVRFLLSQEQGRVFSFFRPVAIQNLGDYDDTQDNLVLKSELLFPNKNLVYEIESIDYEGDPMTNKSISKLVEYVGGAVSSFTHIEGIDTMKLTHKERFDILMFRKPIMDFLNVKYLLSSYDADTKIITKIFKTEVTDKKIPVYIYKNNEARELYYFTDESWLADVGKDISPEELNEKLKNSHGRISQNGITLAERRNDSIVLDINIPSQQLLVFSQNNLPGWQAYIDGKEVKIDLIGSVYMGVLVPSGRHEVFFKYSYWEIWKYFLDKTF